MKKIIIPDSIRPLVPFKPMPWLPTKGELEESLAQYDEETRAALLDLGYIDEWLEIGEQAAREFIRDHSEKIIEIPSSGMMTTKQVASYLGMKPRSIADLANQGELPGSKIPHNSRRGTWRFKKEDIEKWLNSGKKRRKRKGKRINTWGDA